jgi:hypothetical protein
MYDTSSWNDDDDDDDSFILTDSRTTTSQPSRDDGGSNIPTNIPNHNRTQEVRFSLAHVDLGTRSTAIVSDVVNVIPKRLAGLIVSTWSRDRINGCVVTDRFPFLICVCVSLRAPKCSSPRNDRDATTIHYRPVLLPFVIAALTAVVVVLAASLQISSFHDRQPSTSTSNLSFIRFKHDRNLCDYTHGH